MALNTYAEAFFPQRADGAVLALNALLGLGTALAPVLVAIVVGLGVWWLLPVVVACIMMLIFGISLSEPLRPSAGTVVASAPTSVGLRNLPDRFWFYAAAVFLYGILETLNGNWARLYLSVERGVSAQGASFALAAFWAMVTAGGVLIAFLSQAVPARWIYVTLPLLLLIVFQVSSRVQDETGGIVVFGLAGLACSAFLPLSISFGGDEFPYLSGVIAGELIGLLSTRLRRRCVRNRSAAERARIAVLHDLRDREHRRRATGRRRLVRHPAASRCSTIGTRHTDKPPLEARGFIDARLAAAIPARLSAPPTQGRKPREREARVVQNGHGRSRPRRRR
jgi:hypothetical protein